MRKAHLLAFFCLIVGVGTAAAQSRDTVYTVGEITVTATRERTASSRVPQRVSVIDSAAIQSSGAQDLADLLESRSGFFIRRYGEGLAAASLRGSGASQTVLLIDGLRLSDPQLGQFDLSLLPSYLMRSVEVVHGPTSAMYGTAGLAGAVNLRGIQPKSDRVTLASEIGAYGERRMSGSASLEGPRVSGLVAAEYATEDGDFPYLNEALFPARVVRRRNADRKKRSIFSTIETSVVSHRVQAAVLYADAQQGLPGGAGSPSVGERQSDEHLRIWLEDRIALKRGRIDLQSFVHSGALRYVNPQLDLDETGRTLTSGFEGVLAYPLSPDVHMTTGATGGAAYADHPSLLESAREYHGAMFASASASIGNVLLYPAVRADAYLPSNADAETAVSPHLGVNVPLHSSLPLYAKANAASAFRMPTFNDRFWQPGGNQELRPERTRSFDLGLYLEQHRAALELTGFYSRTTDQIVWTNTGSDIWSPKNLSKTESTGLEASARWMPTASIGTGLFYIFTRAVDRSDPQSRFYGRQLRYVPRLQVKAYARLEAGPFQASVHGRYVGRRFVTSDESESLAPALLVQGLLGASRSLGPLRVHLSVVVENVLDTRYALIQNYPMPPRHARVRLLIETP